MARRSVHRRLERVPRGLEPTRGLPTPTQVPAQRKRTWLRSPTGCERLGMKQRMLDELGEFRNSILASMNLSLDF